jgi:selenocysteine-specific elongation factor
MTESLVLGTAGHIDHGKTALVKALTGKDTDRLPDEKRRGISIDLGYAHLRLPSGRPLSIVDVPGHERFVRTMVAGATGVDLFLLCVAADDGVMPQTREHIAVLRALGVIEGVVAVTKADLADPARAALEAGELAPGAEMVAVCAPRRDGLEELLRALDRAGSRTRPRQRDGPPVLHIDRSFSLQGIGTIVTGTLWSGQVSAGDAVTILPQRTGARVRGVQVHDQSTERAVAGQRVALNLARVGWREVRRGDAISTDPDALRPTYLIDGRVTLERHARVRAGERLHVHHGTRETPARIVPLDPAGTLYQLRLERPLIVASGDRFVLRSVAPPDTLGGGVVLDPAPRKHRGDADVVEGLLARERGEQLAPGGPKPPPATPNRAPAALDTAARRIAELLRSDAERPRADAELSAVAGVDPREGRRRLRALEQAGVAVRLGRNLHIDAATLRLLERRIIDLCRRDGATTIARVRDELGTSRRYAQALLEYLDAEKVTLRRGDQHVLRRRN